MDEDEELKRALALSRQDIDVEDEEADLRRAIQLSMQGTVQVIQKFKKCRIVVIVVYKKRDYKIAP